MKIVNTGVWYVAAAYFIWGVLPIYWKQLSEVPAEVILTHRVWWSAVFLGLVLWFQGRGRASLYSLFNKRTLLGRVFAAVCVAGNWLTYVWAMGHGYIAEAGLGYFVCPLMTIALAALIFKERLTLSQLMAIALVAIGVSVKVIGAGGLPWVALALALSWALYATVRKAQDSEPLSSLYQEVLVMLPGLLFFMLTFSSEYLLRWYGVWQMLLLLLSGPLTVVPIVMLVQGLKTVRMSSVALLQFLTPSLTLLAALLLGESFSLQDLYAYVPIWVGVAVFAGVRIPAISTKASQ